MHTGVNTVEINTEAAGSNITEYHPPDDRPSAGMFGFLFLVIYCAIFHTLISLCLTMLMFELLATREVVWYCYNFGPVCLSVYMFVRL